VDDVAKTIDHLLSLEGVLIQPKTNVGGDINVAVVSDPFGNQIGLIEGT
jgi:predicted enzyme related to lactoylglutathione lyase